MEVILSRSNVSYIATGTTSSMNFPTKLANQLDLYPLSDGFLLETIPYGLDDLYWSTYHGGGLGCYNLTIICNITVISVKS